MGHVSCILIETIHQTKNKSNHSTCLLLEEVGASVISLFCIKNRCRRLRFRSHGSIHAFNNTAHAVLKTTIHSSFLLWRLSNETVSVVCVRLFSGICGFICPHLSVSVYVCLFVSVCMCVWVAFIMQWCIYLPLPRVGVLGCILILLPVRTNWGGDAVKRGHNFQWCNQEQIDFIQINPAVCCEPNSCLKGFDILKQSIWTKRFCAFLGLSSDSLSP